MAFSSMAWNTGSNSPGDELMTRSTSDVAFCCSSDSLSSRVRCCSASKKPDVLNRDDGLGGKGLEKRNLLIRKRINLGTSKQDCSDRHSLTQQWNTNSRSMSQPSREGASFGKFLRLRLEINYMNRFSLENRAACNLPTHARETNADILRDRSPVGGYT
jgi:hypothetical protein